LSKENQQIDLIKQEYIMIDGRVQSEVSDVKETIET
jgi:hypothetical protein